MTDDEKAQAQEQFRLDFQSFMQTYKGMGRCGNVDGGQGKRYRQGRRGR